jgi:4-azaleucine resistance transporter AzlC
MKREFSEGVFANLPIGVSVFVYSSVLGILSVQKGVALHELVLMNVFIFAGSAQFVMVDMWGSTLNITAVVLAALMINLRYFLIGASLHPVFLRAKKRHKFFYMHFVGDENWAITMGRIKTQSVTPMFLFGGGIALFSIWSAGAMSGYLFGGLIANPEQYGLDFLFVALFTALCVNLYQGKQDHLPWIIAMGVAIISERYIDGKFYIVLGALAGSLSAVILHKKQKSTEKTS